MSAEAQEKKTMNAKELIAERNEIVRMYKHGDINTFTMWELLRPIENEMASLGMVV